MRLTNYQRWVMYSDMAYKFENGMAQTVKTYEQFWNGELNRAILPVIIGGYEPDRPKPACYPDNVWIHGCSQQLFADRNVSVVEVVDCIEYAMSCLEFLGDAFPMVNMDFTGAGITAAYLGATLTITETGIWFFPKDEAVPIGELHAEYDPDNYWLNRTKDIIIECTSRFGNDVALGLPDLGGVIDIIASLRGTNELLMDLHDNPEEVKRLINEVSALWKRYFSEIQALCSGNAMHTNWSGILSAESTNMFQADFAYMIGPPMFNEIILPELIDNFGMVQRPCYHLDGTGQLRHLDSLLGVEQLRLIQWIPGSGIEPVNYWIDVHNRILESGKLLQVGVEGYLDEPLDAIITARGSLKGVTNFASIYDKKDRDKGLRLLEKYHG